MKRSVVSFFARGPFEGACIVVVLFVASQLQAQSLDSATLGKKENLDLPFNASLTAPELEEEDAPEVITFYSYQFEGDGVFFAIDRSGSMSDRGELPIAKREVTKNINEFSPNVQFAVVFFDREIKQWPESGRPAVATLDAKRSAVSWTQAIRGGGGSCAQQGLIAALKFANQSTSTRKVVIYVGDGGGWCHGANEVEYLAQTLGVVKSQNHQRAQINAIGVLKIKPVSDQFLQQLTRQNRGSYTRVVR